jgi:hypothetical protein
MQKVRGSSPRRSTISPVRPFVLWCYTGRDWTASGIVAYHFAVMSRNAHPKSRGLAALALRGVAAA